MKKAVPESKKGADADMRREYDFRGGVRGRHYRGYRAGHTVRIHKADGTVSVQHFTPAEGAVMLEPDVRKYFPDSDAVNKALRALITLRPGAPAGRKPAGRRRQRAGARS